MIVIKVIIYLFLALLTLFILTSGAFLYLKFTQPKGGLQVEVMKTKEDLKENFNNGNPNILVIDDYSQFIEDCENEDEPTIQEAQREAINSQEKRMKENKLKKRRKRNRIAKKSRQRNRK